MMDLGIPVSRSSPGALGSMPASSTTAAASASARLDRVVHSPALRTPSGIGSPSTAPGIAAFPSVEGATGLGLGSFTASTSSGSIASIASISGPASAMLTERVDHRRPSVPRIDTNQLPTPAASRNALFFSPTNRSAPLAHSRNILGSSQTFGGSASNASLVSVGSTGTSSATDEGGSGAQMRWTASIEQGLAAPACQLSSASSIRSRRNWDEFEGKPVSPLPSPAALGEEPESPMFDRPPSATDRGSQGSAHIGSEPDTPSKTSAFFGTSWASYPRAPSSIQPPPPRRDRVASSSDAAEEGTSSNGWSNLPSSTRAISLEHGQGPKLPSDPSAFPEDKPRHCGLSGFADFPSHSRLWSGESSQGSEPPYSPSAARVSGAGAGSGDGLGVGAGAGAKGRGASGSGPPGAAPTTSSASLSSASGSTRDCGPQPGLYDGLPLTDSSSASRPFQDRFSADSWLASSMSSGADPPRPGQRMWKDLDDGADGGSSSGGRSGGDLGDELLPLGPSTKRPGRASRYGYGPSEIASGSSLAPSVDPTGASAASGSTAPATATAGPAVVDKAKLTVFATGNATPNAARLRTEAEEVREEQESGDIIGPYRREAILGVGAFSQVALGRAVRPSPSAIAAERRPDTMPGDELVALKMLDREPCSHNERLKVSWVREVEVLKHISHPNLVRFVTAFSTPLHHTLVLEHIAGGELFELLAQQHDAIAQREWLVRRIFAELANAVGWMHHVNLVHRDIKLENILLTTPLFSDGQAPLTPLRLPKGPLVKLTDFGLSRFIDPNEPSLETRCGSEEYAAPELIIGKRYDGRKTDAWALGVVLYALLTGSLPFVEANNGDSDGHGFAASREGHSGDRDAKQRKAHLLRIAKGDLRWPEQINDPPQDRPEASICPANLRLVTITAKLIVARLLRRDAMKRANVWDVWDADWMVRGSFDHEATAAGERLELLPDPRSEAGQAWLAAHASFRHSQVSQLACDD